MHLALSILTALGALGFALSGCRGSGQEIEDPVREAITQVVTTFFSEAFSEEGDTALAYSQFDSETRESCSMAEFARLASIGRGIVGGKLKVHDVGEIKLADGQATAKVRASMRRVRASFLYEDVTLVEEDGVWRYKETRNPDCDEEADFFRLGIPIPTRP